MAESARRIFLGVTGASGAPYAVRTLQLLLAAGAAVDLCYSPSARRVLREECGIEFDGRDPQPLLADGAGSGRLLCHDHADIGAPPASGTALGDTVIVAPCSLTTLAGLAEGRAGNLIERAAQVALKEGRRLIVVPRETPLSAIHLENLLKLARLGVRVVPAIPAFYSGAQKMEELVDFVIKNAKP
jgi:4-hydroxy-3-polyprenylbenzoate decarboxylase